MNGLFSANMVNCDGTSPTVVMTRQCVIPMVVLISDPYLLPEDTLVVATIEALNEIGYSDPSEENVTGAFI
jgi:hypothetical protein